MTDERHDFSLPHFPVQCSSLSYLMRRNLQNNYKISAGGELRYQQSTQWIHKWGKAGTKKGGNWPPTLHWGSPGQNLDLHFLFRVPTTWPLCLIGFHSCNCNENVIYMLEFSFFPYNISVWKNEFSDLFWLWVTAIIPYLPTLCGETFKYPFPLGSAKENMF